MMETKGIKLVLEVTVAAMKGRLRSPKLVSQSNPSAISQAAKAAEALVPQPQAQPDTGPGSHQRQREEERAGKALPSPKCCHGSQGRSEVEADQLL